MARIPFTLHLTILAGVIVVFNHCASSETGDVALNKVTGAASRFYTLFHDGITALHDGCTSRLETALCGPILSGIIPHDAKLRYCHTPVQDPESRDGASDGSGSSDFAFVYHQRRTQPLGLHKDIFGQTHGWSDDSHLSRTLWDWSSEVMVAIGAFLLRVWASWWWFTAPLKATGVLLVAYSAVLAFDCLFKTNVVGSRMYVAAATEFLQCIQWEGQRRAWDVGVAVMVRVYSA